MYMYKHGKYRDNDEEYNELLRESARNVAYWRKANQIRQWIVDHTEMKPDDNCEFIPMTKELLEKLIEDCQMVIDNPNLAQEIMPTSSDSLFGSTAYDEWYFDDLHITIKQIKNILETTDFDNEMIEYTEWW